MLFSTFDSLAFSLTSSDFCERQRQTEMYKTPPFPSSNQKIFEVLGLMQADDYAEQHIDVFIVMSEFIFSEKERQGASVN